MRAPSAGQVLGGKYRLVRHLGKGGRAAVWLAEHLTLHSPVALKVIEPVVGDEEDALQRFLREARAAAALRSPHVVQILDYGIDDELPYIVMELLEGESLEQRLERVKRLPLPELARVMKHVARALSRAHDAGIVHRDLEPANIFIVPNDDEELIKVLDFGVAKATTPVGALLGTPHYLSPEQAEGVRTLDHRSDLWSLGIVAYECLLGSVPFWGQSREGVLTAICSKPLPVPSLSGPVPPGFDAWFARACARSPDARFASARQMAEELSRVFELSRAMPPGPAPQLLRSELGIAPVQLPAPASLGLFDGLMRYKGVLVLAALGAFAAGAALLERHKPRLERPLASSVAPSPARGAPSLEAPSLEAPSLEAPPLEAVRESFSGLGRRVGPVPESAKATRSAPAAAVPPLALTLAPVVAPVAAAVPASAPAAAPASSIVTRTAPLRPAPAKASVERAGSAADAACEPPWFVDSRGIRRVKPRCL